ncbi:GGDEF domain-containing protein [Piscinibacter sp.]|jgi:diguanylate cyclase|uniref:GGDEF domain-containing protein n=1 Tax=Piscinibacter sp. TaxID=1903157 RepID=UPI003559C2E2
MQPPSSDTATSSEPGRFHGLIALTLRHGRHRSTLVLTLLVAVFTVAISQFVISVAGHGDRLIATLSALLCSLLLTPVFAALMLRLVFELDRTRQQLTVLATQDDLTGVYNRHHFLALAAREWDRARRYNTAAALLLIDADRFKRVNDAHGQLCGDELLRRIARAVGASLRQADLLARFGGAQFIVFLPHTDGLGALDVAERIREQVQTLSMEWQGTQVGTTVSVGVAPMRTELPSLDWMIHEADTALYAAKADGRNCVRTLPFEPTRSGDVFHVDRR